MTYVGAPYNFVSFPDKVIVRYDDISQLPRHDRYVEGAYTGNIQFSIVAETPIMVSNGISSPKQFLRNEKGDFIIPGNTMRGLLRTAVQVLGQCDISADIEDQRYLYRMFSNANKSLGNQYKQHIGFSVEEQDIGGFTSAKTVLTHVKAGYIKKTGKDSYVIIPAKVDHQGRQYYKVKEFEMRRMPGIAAIQDKIKWMYSKDIANHVHARKRLIAKDWEWYEQLKRIEQKTFEPYSTSISYSFDTGRDKVTDLAEASKLPLQGTILCTGFVQRKIHHYVVREPDAHVPGIPIDKSDIEAYERDLRLKKGNKEYYRLPRDEHMLKPVFYITNGERVDFGFMPYLRVFYNHSVREGVPPAARISGEQMDYAQSIFGFVNRRSGDEKASYRGRISVMDLHCTEGKTMKEQSMMLFEPRAASYPLYVKQNDVWTSYNDSGFELRGMKQYWMRQAEAPEAVLDRDG
ncbi:TIGR03986 family CRISPR-associated RAMP protein [Paenibacillus chartarius]|uniref:TIGR03986 family CRISPR-associated RAMP protein n=1 Tax=Paenibacillus chartarius TaxID=747481 RepID=A0ABV6DTL2_9BACL